MITMKRGDTSPDLSLTLTDNGAVVNLVTAVTIKVIGSMNGTVVFSRTVTGTSQGVVTMPWQAPDTATPGMLELECQVSWPGVSSPQQTFPADGVLYVNIAPDLG